MHPGLQPRGGENGSGEPATDAQSSRPAFSAQGAAAPTVVANASARLPPPARRRVHSSRTGMRFDPLMPIDDWKTVGARIAFYSQATAWWLGDWLLFGKMKYGHRYKEGIALTGLDYQTLRNYALVARRFELSRRRDNLSFQHHAEVCALQNDVQDQWLDLAADARWSKMELRRRLRAAAAEPAASPAGTTLHLVVEAQRDERWRAAAKRSGCPLEVWITRSLDAAASESLLENPEGRSFTRMRRRE